MLDVASLLQGEVDIEHENRAIAINLAAGSEHVLTSAELLLLAEVPEQRWKLDTDLVANDPTRQQALDGLIEKQLVAVDSDESTTNEMLARAEGLADTGWFGAAALYHYTSKWHEPSHSLELDAPGADGLQRVRGYNDQYRAKTRSFGAPPAIFYRPSWNTKPLPLPSGERDGPLYQLLRRRRTSRGFDRDLPLTVEALATILRTTYGCQGTVPLTDDLTVMRKTSPSGGALHPVEAYPLIVRVSGVAPGLYHYSVEDHELMPLTTMSEQEAEETIDAFTAGQTYYRSAHVLVVMVARFFRNFWKYRGNAKAYKVLLMDAAHLSQTFYLVCTELGLGAFFTGAVSDVKIEKALNLDPIKHGVIGVSGCGTLCPGEPDGSLPTSPFRPGHRG